MDAATKWKLWGTAVGVSFLAVEIPAILEEPTDGKPSGTLTEVLRSFCRDSWWRKGLLAGALVWAGGHLLLGWGPNNIMRRGGFVDTRELG